MKVANADGVISAILNVYNPLQAEVRRIPDLQKFLDAVNFSSGQTQQPTRPQLLAVAMNRGTSTV